MLSVEDIERGSRTPNYVGVKGMAKKLRAEKSHAQNYISRSMVAVIVWLSLSLLYRLNS